LFFKKILVLCYDTALSVRLKYKVLFFVKGEIPIFNHIKERYQSGLSAYLIFHGSVAVLIKNPPLYTKYALLRSLHGGGLSYLSVHLNCTLACPSIS